mgnify:CR=1 FL=1
MEYSMSTKVTRTSQRLALLLRAVVVLAIVAGLALLAASVLVPELWKGWIRNVYPQVTDVSEWQVVLLALLATAQLGLTTIALWWLARMFSSVSGEEPLSLEAAAHMRRASRWLLAATLYAMVAQIPASLVASLNQPEGARFIALGLSTSHASGVLASLVLYAVASIQELAAQVRDDNRQIV